MIHTLRGYEPVLMHGSGGRVSNLCIESEPSLGVETVQVSEWAPLKAGYSVRLIGVLAPVPSLDHTLTVISSCA